jgi:hypothetical protein
MISSECMKLELCSIEFSGFVLIIELVDLYCSFSHLVHDHLLYKLPQLINLTCGFYWKSFTVLDY